MEALYAVIAADGLDKDEAERIAGESRGQASCPSRRSRPDARARGFSSSPASTSCSRGGAPDSVTLNLTPIGVERLARAFTWLFDELHGEFTFELLWGEAPIDKVVSREELVRIVRTGHLAGRTRYRVLAG